MKIIETERLILRPFSVGDAQDAFESASDPVVNRYMPYPLHKDIQQTKDWISSLGKKDEFCFCLKSTGKAIGFGCVTFHPEYEAYELGYNLSRTFWGAGYATEASKAMIQWAWRNSGACAFLPVTPMPAKPPEMY